MAANKDLYIEPQVAKVRDVDNPTYQYFQTEEKLHGFLSQQFPTTGNSAPLGLCGFALTTFTVSIYNSGALGSHVALNGSSQGVVLGLALFYGGLVQILAGMWEFKTGNTFGALSFTSYGGFWMSYAALFINAFGFLDGYNDTVELNNCMGVYYTAWGIFTFFMTIASHRTTVVLFFLFLTLWLTFVLLAISSFHNGDLESLRGASAMGLCAAFLAWYGAFAGLLTEKISLFTLPVGDLDPIWRSYGLLKPLEDPEEVFRTRNSTISNHSAR